MIDQAQHFAALGPAGGGGQSADSALAFREGLEVTERERESQITVVPTAGYTYLDLKSMLSRRKAQRRPNSGTSLWIGYGDDGVSRPPFATYKTPTRAFNSPFDAHP